MSFVGTVMKSVPVTIGVVVSLMSAPGSVGIATLERRRSAGLIGRVSSVPRSGASRTSGGPDFAVASFP